MRDNKKEKTVSFTFKVNQYSFNNVDITKFKTIILEKLFQRTFVLTQNTK